MKQSKTVPLGLCTVEGRVRQTTRKPRGFDQLPRLADREEDVQVFTDVDSDANVTVSECVFSDDENVEQSAIQLEPV